ncbi:MAG: HD domain-containing protein [Bryobacteraceae bacterium]|nr:HD domain-containing protein [Bryobacteraceae bacterium]
MPTQRFADALVFANELHAKQKRKTTGTPYFSHLMIVAGTVMEDGGSEDEVIAALLHDAIEDQARRYPGGEPKLRDDIRARFGDEVLRLVEACTEDYLMPDNHGRTVPWRALREEYLKHVQAADRRVRRIVCADKLHNVRSLIIAYRTQGDEVWQRFRTRSRDDQMWFHDELAEILVAAGTGPLALELQDAVKYLRAATA